MNTTADSNGSLQLPTTTPWRGFYWNVWEPDLQVLSRMADTTIGWIASSFIIVMIISGIAKILRRTGWKVFNIAHRGVSFPQRPELFVLIFSSIPTIVTILTRPLISQNNPVIVNFIVGWYVCQTRMFLDYFTRTAALFHLIFWAYRDTVIRTLYSLHLRVHNIPVPIPPEPVKEPLTEPGAEAVIIPPVVDEAHNIFAHRCKIAIPGCIYFLAFMVNLPLCFTMVAKELQNGQIVCENGPMYIFYDYYELIVLVGLPWLAMIIRFYSAAIGNDKKSQMIYRLRCYYVTFILLTTPLFVLLITLKLHQQFDKSWKHNKFGNGVIVAVTAYHANFAIKPLIYTTGCNCICCSRECMERSPRVKLFVVYWSTPQKKEKTVELKPVPQPKDDGTIADLVDWFGHGDEEDDNEKKDFSTTREIERIEDTPATGGLLDKHINTKDDRVTFKDERNIFGNGFKMGGIYRSGKSAMLPP